MYVHWLPTAFLPVIYWYCVCDQYVELAWPVGCKSNTLNENFFPHPLPLQRILQWETVVACVWLFFFLYLPFSPELALLPLRPLPDLQTGAKRGKENKGIQWFYLSWVALHSRFDWIVGYFPVFLRGPPPGSFQLQLPWGRRFLGSLGFQSPLVLRCLPQKPLAL